MVRTRTPGPDVVDQVELERLSLNERVPLVITAAGLRELGRPVPVGLADDVTPAPWLLEGLAAATRITCVRCGRTTTDPDRWDPEADTGRIFCDACWDHRDELVADDATAEPAR